MGTFSIWHWIIILAVVLLLFGGGGKIPKLMRDMGEGITAFRKGLKKDEKPEGGDSQAGGQGAGNPPLQPPAGQAGTAQPSTAAQAPSQGAAQGPAKS
ncbi:MAG: twin-arginine translocase TatA/TatE family subunit [Alphaproteobacteria bacterium]|nr:twin-arginine translocase TatA/TatE family subunit [Alphaproteobacteria bacterium]